MKALKASLLCSGILLTCAATAMAADALYPLEFVDQPQIDFIPEEFEGVKGITFTSFTGDMNGDGFPDVVCKYSNNAMYLWQNTATVPTEFTPQIIDIHSNVQAIGMAADLNNDGRQDFVATKTQTGTIVWYENLGGEPLNVVKRTTSLGVTCKQLAAGDVNGDDLTDLVGMDTSLGVATWFESSGGADPTFTSHVVPTTLSAPTEMVLKDIDSDGNTDIAILHRSSEQVEVAFKRPATDTSFEIDRTSAIGLQLSPGSNQLLHFLAGDVFCLAGWNPAAAEGNRLTSTILAVVSQQRCSASTCTETVLEFSAADFNNDGKGEFSSRFNTYSGGQFPFIPCTVNGTDTIMFEGAPDDYDDPHSAYDIYHRCNMYISPNQHFVDVDLDGDLDLMAESIGETTSAFNTSRRTDQGLGFGYNLGPQDWTFAAPDIFAPSTGAWNDGSLDITTNDNTNTFSFWESPIIRLGGDGSGILTDIPNTGAEIYKFTAFVTSSNPSRVLAPVIRIRSSSESFEQSDVLVATSTANGGFSPDTVGYQYEHYFTLPSNQAGTRLDFDVLNVNPADARDITCRLEQSGLDYLPAASLTGARHERTYAFGQSEPGGAFEREGWVPRGAAPFAVMPIFEDNIDGIAIRADSTAMNQFTFGFWDSADSPDPVTMVANRLYRFRATVTSDEANTRRNEVPNFRIRLNTADFRGSAYLNAESISTASRVPVGGEFLVYDLYFHCPPQLDGQKVLLAFDFLHYPGLDTGRETRIILKSLAVDSFNAPK